MPNDSSLVSNPANRNQAAEPQPVEEQLLAQWEEPEREPTSLEPQTRMLVYVAGPIVVIGFILLGIFLKRFSFYLGAVAALSAIAAIIAQSKQRPPSLTISLTNTRLIVGKKSHLLSDLSGFWLQPDGDYLVVHVEMTKPTIIPISFTYANDDREDARATLSQLLAEVEPRTRQIGDSVNRYFRL